MAVEVIDIKCPGCGAPVSMDQGFCNYCGRPISITSFSSISRIPKGELRGQAAAYEEVVSDHPESVAANKSLGLCYIEMGLHDKALDAFERAISADPADSESYFYAACAMLGGEPAGYVDRQTVDQAISYAEAASKIESRGIYDLLNSYMVSERYEKKFLNHSPSAAEYLSRASSEGVSQADKSMLFEMLKVDEPA